MQLLHRCRRSLNNRFFFSSRRRHTRCGRDWSSDVCSSDLTNMVLPQMAEKGSGSVVLLSSIAGIRGNTTIGTYGVSKAAEAALARNLAVEWGPKGIRVNSIAPGLIKTDFAKALWEDPVRVKRAEDKTPLRRIGDPIDIAGLAVFLATPASAYITGQVIVADGGETIC